MDQLRVAGTRRKPNNLLFKLPKPKSPRGSNKNLEADLPRTPFPVPMHKLKRSASFSGQDYALEEGEVKRRKTVGEEGIVITTPCLMSSTSLGSRHFSASMRCISSVELTKAWESIFIRVDWSEVVLDVVGNETSAFYQEAFEKTLQARIKELLKQGGCKGGMCIDCCEKDEEDSQDTENTGSEDDRSDDDSVNGSEHLDGNNFVESEEENKYWNRGDEDFEENSEGDWDSEEDDHDCETTGHGILV